ncbi:MAG TPA: hypothetical protein VH081_11975 [Solirubrobacteraceae bacterium]|nr:hypothetical protein [Solirubrobacteraceae bacterium]
MALLVHGCQVNATQSALEDYANSVSSLNSQSAANGKQLFTQLAQASASGNPQSVQNGINQVLNDEKGVYKKAQQVSVPDQVKTGNANFLMALKMRIDGTTNISNEIQPALSTSATPASVTAIAQETERLYASDIIYKDYALPQIYGALHAAGARFSPINGDQFVPNVEWVSPTFLAQTLGVSTPTQTSGKPTPGLHGHSLTSVSVNGSTLQPGGATNTLPTGSVPSFVLTFNNGGTNNEHNVKCKVSINGSSVSGTATVPETFAGKNAQCTVKLNAAPPAGTQTVVATIEKVLGEKNVSNNTLTYTITFQ